MDYKNGKIYKLITNDLEYDKVYIGSTCSELYKRLYQHKSRYTSWKHSLGTKYYLSSIELFRNINDIGKIENFSCKDKNELHAREAFWIEKNKDNCVNLMKPYSPPEALIECGCGKTYKNARRLKHIQTVHHKNYENTK
ncbi:MAG: GIY-YIG nuclease family protein [Bacteroidetes bacterium]|nr:GIY-YIG nuclease family protein [Bacteroidota bacterium]